MKTAKRIVRALGLRNVAGKLARAYARARPHQVVERDGVTYELDLANNIDLGIWLGGWEPGTIKFLRENVHPGDVVLEVGANIGAHTFIIADLVGVSGTVHAFEPTDRALNKLRASLARNPDLQPRVKTYRNLITDHEGSTPLLDIKSAWRVDHVEIPPEHVTAEPISLDTFAKRWRIHKVDLLKIDVDGYDVKVLRGATELLERFRPVVFVECCEYALNKQGDSVRDIWSLLTGLGYRAEHEDGRPINSADEILAIVGNETSINGVFRR